MDFKINCNPIILCCTFKNTEHLKWRILMKHYVQTPLLLIKLGMKWKLWKLECLFWSHGDFKRKMKDDTRLCSCTLIKIHLVFLLSLNNKLIIHSNELVKIRAPAITQRISIAALSLLILTLKLTLFLYVTDDKSVICSCRWSDSMLNRHWAN